MDQKDIEETRARFNMMGGVDSFKNQNVSGIGGGGRFGVSKELDSGDSISAGVSGRYSDVKVKTPEGERNIKEGKITGADLSYTKGDTTYGISASREPFKKVSLSMNKTFAKGGAVTKKKPATASKKSVKPMAKKGRKS